MKITYGGEILSHDYFRTWYSCILDAEKHPQDVALFERCGEICSWLAYAATESRKAGDLGLEDRIYPVFGFNGSSYQFYENAAKQIAEWTRIYARQAHPEIYGQFKFNDFEFGYKMMDKSTRDKPLEARNTLIRILDKIDILKSRALQRKVMFDKNLGFKTQGSNLERALA